MGILFLNKEALHYKGLIYISILQVFCHLPLHKALPVHISAILQSVNNLRFYRTSGMILLYGCHLWVIPSALCWAVWFFELQLEILSIGRIWIFTLIPRETYEEKEWQSSKSKKQNEYLRTGHPPKRPSILY